MHDEAYFLLKCRLEIEKKLGWGDSLNWQGQDFEMLSDRIREETSVLLSSSTLKRIWGKVRYDSSPNLATLNALSQFAAGKNWRTFTAGEPEIASTAPQKQQIASASNGTFKSVTRKLLPALGAIALVIIIALRLTEKKHKILTANKVKFSSRPATIGLPNTIIFRYDVAASNADSVFIQQSWDQRKRFRVDKQLHEFTSTYYLPGYYRAKLILNDSIIKEHDVFISTLGWIGIIEEKPVPIYLSKNLYEDGKAMSITEKDLMDQKVSFDKEPPVVSFFKVDTSISLPSDHLQLDVELQNTFEGNNGICKKTTITLLGTEGVISIPLSSLGCVGELTMMIGMGQVDGKTNDLSGFGVDFATYASVRCTTENGVIQIWVNDREAYRGEFKKNIGRVIGAGIRFMGTGVVKRFELKKG